MHIFHDLDHQFNIPNPVVTTGSFDGVHVGHKAIINRLNRLAMEIEGESVLITFHPHPRKVLYPDTAGKDLFLINSQHEKIELLRNSGLKNLIIITFTREFSQISSIDFIRNILVNKLHARKVVIGFNHHFGFNREGNFEFLTELGNYYNFEVEEIPEQDIHNETVSSTLIRKALQDGRIQRANAYLDHHYSIMGKLSAGLALPGSKGFATFQLEVEEECKLIPPDGVYAVRLTDGIASLKGILNIKNSRYDAKRSFHDVILEIYPFADAAVFSGREVTVSFAKRIRDELTFDDSESLFRQITRDKAEVDELIY